MITVEPLSPKLFIKLKEVRLRALQNDPLAFGRSYADEILLSENDWLNRASTWNNGSSSVCYIANDSGVPCGMVAGYLDSQAPLRPNVAAMWVAPEYRRTGLGNLLMNKVVLWAQQQKANRLRLIVTDSNSNAIRFYEACGFTLTGNLEPSLINSQVQQCEMVKVI